MARVIDGHFVGPPDDEPICLLCGIEISHIHSTEATSSSCPGVAFQEEQWKAFKGTRLQHILVPSSEVENAYFHKYPRLWESAYRGILKGPNGKHYLTGIHLRCSGETAGRDVPRDPHLARIGGSTRAPRFNNSTFVHYHNVRMGRQPRFLKGLQCGYTVHAHCWMLLDRAFDGGRVYIEAKLDRFIRAPRKYWRGNKLLWGTDNWDWEMFLDDSDPDITAMMFYHGCYIYQNPLVDPEFKCLPLDVVTLIAEQVCPVRYTVTDVENIRNMLAAFQWVLPEFFWSARCRRYVIFELNDIKNTSPPVDWEALQLDLMRLLADGKSGLSNRARIMGLIGCIKSNFFSKRK
ncbi:hypothetical protein PHISCL_07489 [Aspergillus sclerotialis]|uniref:Uncharacterized protein n=1 Tax=Aspergillus sclerotialis TaxID=2070753 RepID=A0A3A2ZAN4_9EURO|nr:hypothetical protein PHISCL_07489 [Aspergillus sclerotialis]